MTGIDPQLIRDIKGGYVFRGDAIHHNLIEPLDPPQYLVSEPIGNWFPVVERRLLSSKRAEALGGWTQSYGIAADVAHAIATIRDKASKGAKHNA